MYKWIYDKKRQGSLVFSSEASELELADESLDMNEEVEKTTPTMEESEVPEGDDANKPVEEPVENISKIQTLDVLSTVMQKYDTYMGEVTVPFDALIVNGRVTASQNFAYIDDLYQLLNKTFDPSVIVWVGEFNKLFDKMTDVSFCKNLAQYGREKYGKPFIAEGLALLLYELAVDWATLLVRYFKELPVLKDTDDSFFKKFPNLQLLTYFAELFNNSNEFGKLVSNSNARDLLNDDTKYKLTAEQAKKKPNLYRANGESLSYFASLVRYNYADIMVGAIDKLGTVAFLNKTNKQDLLVRLGIIRDLIETVISKDNSVATTNGEKRPVEAKLYIVDNKATDLLRDRAEARIIFESNEKNYPMVL